MNCVGNRGQDNCAGRVRTLYVGLVPRWTMTTATDLRMVTSVGTGTSPPSNTDVELSSSASLPRLKSELDLNDRTLFAVYCFIKNFIGASGTSAVAIDNKIEQAMYQSLHDSLRKNLYREFNLSDFQLQVVKYGRVTRKFQENLVDLVKSHLMFAVREEVEVLKEKIAELMDRINQLELENTILKANATQETLAQLSASAQPPASSAP